MLQDQRSVCSRADNAEASTFSSQISTQQAVVGIHCPSSDVRAFSHRRTALCASLAFATRPRKSALSVSDTSCMLHVASASIRCIDTLLQHRYRCSHCNTPGALCQRAPPCRIASLPTVSPSFPCACCPPPRRRCATAPGGRWGSSSPC